MRTTTSQTLRHRFEQEGKEIEFDSASVSPPRVPENRPPVVTSLALDVSGFCNLQCAYCAEAATMPRRAPMSQDILHQAVDAVFNWSPTGRAVSFHLGSGEPLLRPKSVQEIGRRAKSQAQRENRQLSLYLTTNGTLLNETIRSWLIEDGWNVKISVDGDVETHNRYRIDKAGKGTYKRLEQSVRTLAERIPERFSTTSVLCHSTEPLDVFQSVAALGVKKIEMVPVATPLPSPLCLGEDDLLAYRRFIFAYMKEVVRNKETPALVGIQKRLRKVLGYGNSRLPCGAGRNFLGVGPDGALYPCFRFIGIDLYRLGDLKSGIDHERVQWFASGPGRPYEQRMECKDCWAAPLCGGPCFACAELLANSDGSPPHDYCSMVRSESEAAIALATDLRKKDPQRLLELLSVRVEG